MILFYDTETSDFPKNDLPDHHVSQPGLVEYGAVLTEDDGTELACASFIVKPEGWVITDGAAGAHGITNEIADRVGVPHMLAVATHCNLRGLATRIVAHNIAFDERIMRYAISRAKRTPAALGPLDIFCTMQSSTAHVNLPPTVKMLRAGFNKPKPPSLSELYKFLFNEEFEGAHCAINDVRAMLRCYFHMRELGWFK